MIQIKKIKPQILKIIARIYPQGDEYEIEITGNTIGQELLDALIGEDENSIELESGEKLNYTMTVKGSGKQINLDETLNHYIKDGDLIIIAPLLIAG